MLHRTQPRPMLSLVNSRGSTEAVYRQQSLGCQPSIGFLTLFRNPVGGITYEVRAIFQIQFGADIEAMRFDGFDTSAQQSGNFLAAVPGSDQMEYFKLAGSQAIDQRFWLGNPCRHSVQQPGMHLLAQVNISLQYLADGSNQHFAGLLLHDISPGASP